MRKGAHDVADNMPLENFKINNFRNSALQSFDLTNCDQASVAFE